jgi:hypothetical protein
MIKKSNVILIALQFELYVLQFALSMAFVLQIKATSDSLLYIKFVVALLVLLLTTI